MTDNFVLKEHYVIELIPWVIKRFEKLFIAFLDEFLKSYIIIQPTDGAGWCLTNSTTLASTITQTTVEKRRLSTSVQSSSSPVSRSTLSSLLHKDSHLVRMLALWSYVYVVIWSESEIWSARLSPYGKKNHPQFDLWFPKIDWYLFQEI